MLCVKLSELDLERVRVKSLYNPIAAKEQASKGGFVRQSGVFDYRIQYLYPVPTSAAGILGPLKIVANLTTKWGLSEFAMRGNNNMPPADEVGKKRRVTMSFHPDCPDNTAPLQKLKDLSRDIYDKIMADLLKTHATPTFTEIKDLDLKFINIFKSFYKFKMDTEDADRISEEFVECVLKTATGKDVGFKCDITVKNDPNKTPVPVNDLLLPDVRKRELYGAKCMLLIELDKTWETPGKLMTVAKLRSTSQLFDSFGLRAEVSQFRYEINTNQSFRSNAPVNLDDFEDDAVVQSTHLKETTVPVIDLNEDYEV